MSAEPEQAEQTKGAGADASVERVAAVAAEHADQVDQEGRFPHEAIAAAREAGLLGALVPVAQGGGGMSLPELTRAVTTIARGCASTGLILAMHHNQVAGLVRHASSPAWEQRLAAVGAGDLLIASATSEKGIGGDIRSSTCAVETDAESFTLVKDAPVISYAEHADIILVTARRTPDSAPNDQVLVWAERQAGTLEPTRAWNTLGLRGTCSNGYLLRIEGSRDAIVEQPFAELSARTMLPWSHALWAAAWLGIAEEAMARARSSVQRMARRTPGVTPPGALRLAEADLELQRLRALVAQTAEQVGAMGPDDEALGSPRTTLAMNGVKVIASTSIVDIVTRALAVVGIEGYRLDSPVSMGRLLRDAHGAALMVSNDRILLHNADLELIHR